MTSECPTCGKNFSCEQGMKSHHAQKHGESIAGFTYECYACGEEFTRDHRSDGGKYNFCSVDCQAGWQSDHHSGENNPAYSGGEYMECIVCGDKFWLSPYQFDHRKTCSKECLSEKHSEDFSEFDNPNWSGGEYKECEICGDKFWNSPSDNGEYCSYGCMGKARHEGGEIQYGPKWRKKRKEVIEEYNVCQRCGSDTEKMHVHHIVPVREFDDPSDAHFFENLTLVCQTCHPTVETMDVAEQRERLK